MKGFTIRDFCGDYALDIPMWEGCVYTIFFNSRRNAEMVKRIMEVDESVPNVATVCDVVEVVRCKDCRFNTFVQPNGTIHCHVSGVARFCKPNDFCSYGERKEQT